ncbi:MAG: glycosyltransferase family 4 protein [Thermodesulfobacteriota bacterium]|nr:glycosyltransferase family 4 protein [Thermodesulfobacteriota bacterium]
MDMRVLLLADVTTEDPASGSEQVLYHHAEGLTGKGIEVCAITREDTGFSPPVFRKTLHKKEVSYCVNTQNQLRFFLSLLKYPPKLFDSFIKEGSFDIVIGHQPFTCFALLIRRKLKNIPMLYVFHSPSHEEYLLQHQNRYTLKSMISVQIRRMIEKASVKRSSKVMVLSHYMKEKLQDTHRIIPDHIIVNPGGADLCRFKPILNRQLLKEKFNLPKDKVHLLTVRNLDPRMGLDNLLQCIAILRKEREDIYLTIGGEGPEKKALEDIVLKYSMEDTVNFTGFIPSELLPEYYAAADLFILPTRSLEGFGLVTPEAMACGTPVLGTPVGGTKEILSTFNPRFLFQDASPESMAKGIERFFEEFLACHNKYYYLRHQCREYAEKNYSWQRHTDKLLSILNEIITLQ